jgi:hypothetical protein
MMMAVTSAARRFHEIFWAALIEGLYVGKLWGADWQIRLQNSFCIPLLFLGTL